MCCQTVFSPRAWMARIQANGMGASNPVAPNTTVTGRTKNRRVEITFTAPRNTAIKLGAWSLVLGTLFAVRFEVPVRTASEVLSTKHYNKAQMSPLDHTKYSGHRL